MTKKHYEKQDPLQQHPRPPFPYQIQDKTGSTSAMKPRPDHGEESYHGFGRLVGRKALITGADSGIGRAVAIAFAREGADVVLNYLPSEQTDADEVLEVLRETGVKVVSCPGDLMSEKFCKELVSTANRELGGLDIIANIAGKQIAQKEISKITTEQFEETFRVNVTALFWICKYALPFLKPGASIINTASIQAYQPTPDLLDYAATKAAVLNFTRSFAKQVIDKGVRVNAVAPGPIWTPLQPSKGQPPEDIPEFGGDTPYGRPGQPVEVAPSYVFLASQESSYMTAEVIGITGGNHLS